MKKKLLIVFTSLLVVSSLLLSACGSSGNQQSAAETTATAEETTAAETTTAAEETTAAESGEAVSEEAGTDGGAMVGGWTVNEEIVTPVLTEESKAAFDKALQSYVGMNLEPAALLATQLVSGTNYMYLCKGEAVVAEPTPGWYVVVVYQDLEGNAEITSVKEIDIANIKTTEDVADANVVGAWEIVPPSNAATLPEDVAASFNKANEGYTGVSLSPLALLGSQLVAGMNYKIFCHGTMVTAEPVDSFYVATMYVDLEGNAEFTDVEKVDIMAYVEQ